MFGRVQRKNNLIIKIALASISVIFLFVLVVSSTYAWFTSNTEVSTSVARARTGEESVKLLLSQSADGNFTESEAYIMQVNKTSINDIMPVSTSDTVCFVDRVIDENEDIIYTIVENEEHYFHGRIYVKAMVSEGFPNAKMKLYFDQSKEAGGEFVKDTNGNLTIASRLAFGLESIGGGKKIFFLNEPDGVEKQSVISMSDGEFIEVSDPSIPLSDYTISETAAGITLPPKELGIIELNKVYPIDVYFYIEGSDPDCSESLLGNEIDLHLGFYGILVE